MILRRSLHHRIVLLPRTSTPVAATFSHLLSHGYGYAVGEVAGVGVWGFGLGGLSGMGAYWWTDPSCWWVVGRLGEVVYGLLMARLPQRAVGS